MNTDLFMALLSLDTYNRGYNASVKIDGTLDQNPITDIIGDATVINYDADFISGFFGIAYNWDGETVIAYRGTDNPDPDPFDWFTADPIAGGSDIFNGWPAAGGVLPPQIEDAEAFYTQVTSQSIYSEASNVVLTGHSLGGGLAGFISALSGTQAYTYDEMPYAAAALAQEIATAWEQGSTLFIDPNAGNVLAYSTEGEVLSYVRAAAGVADELTLESLFGSIYGTAAAIELPSVESEENTFPVLSTYGADSALSSIQLHSAALLVMLMWAQENNQTDWEPFATPLLTSLFDDNLGLDLVVREEPSDRRVRRVLYFWPEP